LPIPLLAEFAESVLARDETPVELAAVSIDARNEVFLGDLKHALARVTEFGINTEFMFLEAEEASLIKRYSETRRMHPLMRDSRSLTDSVKLERLLLAPLSERATKHIDTTNLTPHGLRSLVQEEAAEHNVGQGVLLLKSFAYKYGAPLDADYVFDVRCLPNPYWVEGLRQYNGLEQPIRDYFSGKPEVARMIEQIDHFVSEWQPAFHASGRPYLIVAVGCTGGRHRSVYVVERLEKRFASRNTVVQKRHSEIP